MTKDGKLLPYRHLAPRNSRAGKKKPRKPVSEDEESEDSTVEEQTQEEQRSPSPMLDEPTVKLPEVSTDYSSYRWWLSEGTREVPNMFTTFIIYVLAQT